MGNANVNYKVVAEAGVDFNGEHFNQDQIVNLDPGADTTKEFLAAASIEEVGAGENTANPPASQTA